MKPGRMILVRLVGGGLVFFFSTLLFILLFEVYLRASGFMKAQPANYPCTAGDLQLNHVFLKNCRGFASGADLKTDSDMTLVTNSLGIRGAEPKSGAKKIVLIGDSYTEGFGLAETETLPAQLEQKLLSKGFRGVQVLNGGTLGYSPILYPNYFDRIFAPLKPSLVVLNLDFTDFTDDTYFLQTAEYDSKGSPATFPGREALPQWALPFIYANRSAVLRFLHQEWNLFARLQLREKNFKNMDRLLSTLPPQVSQDDFKRLGVEECQKSMQLTLSHILQLKKRIELAGGRFVLHMYPPGTVVKRYEPGPQGLSFVNWYDQKSRKDFSWACSFSEKSIPLIEEFALKNKIPFLNSVPAILAHPQKELLYFDRDAHWNKKGVAFASDQLATFLAKLLKEKPLTAK